MLNLCFGFKKYVYLIPLLCLGSTRSDKGTDAGEESARLAALCTLVKENMRETGGGQHQGYENILESRKCLK